jgi:KUP system potassium uptake protein
MALMALALRRQSARSRAVIMAMGIFGAALFYGDGVITPAISVLSAVEGLEVAAPALKPWVIPLSIAVLIGLFIFQRKGTASVGALFGPIMSLWFICLAILGAAEVLGHRSVLHALNPIHALEFLTQHGWHAFAALGGVVLAVTGAEALYADMGHFGRAPIRDVWFWFVLPSLVLNYFGQGALLIERPEAIQNPFYLLAPQWALYPMVGLSTAATVIASQAVISGAFSMTRQAVQLGYCPRLTVIHTSEREIGQIYVPWINWVLMIIVIGLVLGFRSSDNLAAAYGIAVTGTMVTTDLLAYTVMRRRWRWSVARVGAVIGFFLTIDIAFFGANLLKVAEGGWFPLVMGAAAFVLMSTWKRGREILAQRRQADAIALPAFLTSLAEDPPTRVPGTAIFMTQNRRAVPRSLLHNLLHNKVLHERVVLLTILTEDIPYVPESERITIESLSSGFYGVSLRYGFKDETNLLKALDECRKFGLELNMMETSFFLSRETVIPTIAPGMALWRERLFAVMVRNAGSAPLYFRIPANRVVELGSQIEI